MFFCLLSQTQSIHAFLKISQIQRFIYSDNPLPPAETIFQGESPRVRSADADEGSKLSVALDNSLAVGADVPRGLPARDPPLPPPLSHSPLCSVCAKW